MTERELLARAAELRRDPTEREIRVWRHLSASQTGYKFRRQHVIVPFICDFFCASQGLVIEIDGDTHDPAADRRRDAHLRAQGFETLRFTNLDVPESLEGVIATIVNALGHRPDRWPQIPHPNPSPEGEGLSPAAPLSFRGGAGGGGVTKIRLS